MSILIVVLILVAVYPLLLAWDLKTMKNPETGEYKSQWLSDSLVLFAPFTLLFYHDNFWHSLLYYFLPFLVYCLLITNIVRRWKKISSPQEMIRINGTGSLLLVVIAYYLFFHEGSMAEKTVITSDETSVNNPWWVWWPFVAIILAGWITRIINSEKLLMVTGLVFLLMPFFSHHPLWAMLLAVVVYLLTCFAIAKKQGNGAYVAVFFFYMLAQIFTLIIYAVFF